MPNKSFLEEFPLFRKFKTAVPQMLIQIPKPPINMHCDVCNSNQTFNMINNYSDDGWSDVSPPHNMKLRLKYSCQACRKFTREFYIYVSPNLDYIYKIGQYPEWDIKIDRNLEITLGKHSQSFKKGLICESQGYGIGAFAYYRRIVEEIIDELLESIIDLINDENKNEYFTALEQTRKTRVTQDKIDLVKDLLPPILRPSSFNPLGLLHSELSEGLHEQSDEVCLEIAAHIREILTFLVNQIITNKNASSKFTDSMRVILEKKSKVLK